MSNITEAVQLMDLMKKRYYQIEYLGKLNDFEHICLAKDVADIPNIAVLVQHMREDVACIEKLIPEMIREFLDSTEYDSYTSVSHGNKFWNELEIPDCAQHYFDVFQRLIGCERKCEKNYELQFYDLYPNSLYFDRLKPLEKMIIEEDFAPFTVYENNGQNSVELYCA